MLYWQKRLTVILVNARKKMSTLEKAGQYFTTYHVTVVVDKSFGKELHRYRVKYRMSRKKLAKLLWVKSIFIKKIECGDVTDLESALYQKIVKLIQGEDATYKGKAGYFRLIRDQYGIRYPYAEEFYD